MRNPSQKVQLNPNRAIDAIKADLVLQSRSAPLLLDRKTKPPQKIFSVDTLRLIKNKGIGLVSFTFLLVLYMTRVQIARHINWLRYIPQGWVAFMSSFYYKSTGVLDPHQGSISRLDLIELSLRNMEAKKSRTFVTIGGMAIGIGAIVFLVSIGYGLQQLVISRVARLDEMKQADVYPQVGGKVKINDKTLSDLKQIPNVKMALPLISAVGRVKYNNSQSDMAVYGVTADYLKQSAIKPVKGKYFTSNEIALVIPSSPDDGLGQVAGASTIASAAGSVKKFGTKTADIEFAIEPDEWVRVREQPDTQSKILGYTKRTEGVQQGQEVWGVAYPESPVRGAKDIDGKDLGKWISGSVKLWEEKSCELSSVDCVEGNYMVLREADKSQTQRAGYFAEVNVRITNTTIKPVAQVLGVSSDSPDSSSNSGSLDFVEIASESAVASTVRTKKVDMPKATIREVIVNRAALSILGIKESDAVGKNFNLSFVVVGDLLSDEYDRVESNETIYKIVAVVPDTDTPILYVPFLDIRSLGVTNYSQVKTVVSTPEVLAKTRRQIEAIGYVTRSVADTVSQINSLFSTIRTILGLLGTVALAVAALGMFNTLTVSLLERTREVGLMKALGMKNEEVRELFLTESMIMGLFGGILGITFGFAAGKLIGLILSIFAIYKGVGYVDVSYLPLPFLLLVCFLSLLVGVITGFYPAYRTTKISALNALRYE